MGTDKKKPRKTKLTISIDQAAYDLLIDRYCGVQGAGEFIAQLVFDHHQRTQQAKSQTLPTPAEVAAELRRLADLLEQTTNRVGDA